MELFKGEIGKLFKIKNFARSFFITWIFILTGMLLFVLFKFTAGAMPAKSYFSYFFTNAGIFLLVSLALMGYAGVYRVTSYHENEADILRKSFATVLGRGHYIVGTALAALVLFLLVVLVEVGFSSIAHIPYAGPTIIALLTIPIFLLNLVCIVLVICIFAIFPPMVSEAQNIRDFLNELKMIIYRKGVKVVLYLIISLSILAVSMVIIFFIFKFSVGITRSVQWKISAAYPQLLMKNFSSASFITELVYRITPAPDPLGAFREYGFRLLNYLDILKYIISLSYVVIASCIISFPLAAYFNFSSSFFRRIWKKS